EIKINNTNIRGYFKEIINSESCGYLKPDVRIYNHALKKANASCNQCIMIGDDLEADILGSRKAGVDAVYFNPNRNTHKEELNYEIFCLSELLNIF
ncbi:MAG: HAD family hydrolase, partial [Cytophagaceae bacterium]